MDRLFDTPADLIEMLKKRPDTLVVTPKYLAVWHTDLETAILIPGRFTNVTDQMAEIIMNENLRTLNAKPIS